MCHHVLGIAVVSGKEEGLVEDSAPESLFDDELTEFFTPPQLLVLNLLIESVGWGLRLQSWKQMSCQI